MPGGCGCTPSTRLYGLIGSPVSKSLSPAIHCAVFREAGVDAVYLAWETRRGELEETVEALRRLAGGFNVTIPLKEDVTRLLDEVDGEAAVIGAVNTVAVEEGRLRGYNTDHLGVRRCIEA
ncbi:MAG: shikimate dehydrogenase, partial [Crenarchaeota archaeon]|nr:shikimate dehydrogenase [Thermoproteota archaeon]